MLQHARDLERDARQRSGWQILILCLRLVKDGILNAGIERWEAILANNRFIPASWFTVLLVFTRVNIK
jgi:hypothetical protein